MLRNFPTTNTLANFFVVIVWLFIFIGMLWAFSVGASEVALNLLGTLITIAVISLLVWVGTKMGWSKATWRVISVLMIIVALVLGFYIYTRYSDQTLVGRSFQLEGREVTMLIPKNLGYKETLKEGRVVAAFGRKGQNISGIGVSIFKPSSTEGRNKIESLSCDDLRETTFTTVSVASFGETFDICRGVWDQGESQLTANIVNSDIYVVGLTVKDSYLDTDTGRENIRKIYESFKVNE